MPVSAESVENRYIFVDKIAGGPTDLRGDSTRVIAVPTYISHFADCPTADQHRKPKEPVQ
jgi:hypothetical protein